LTAIIFEDVLKVGLAFVALLLIPLNDDVQLARNKLKLIISNLI
jgi:hypothetical protein